MNGFMYSTIVVVLQGESQQIYVVDSDADIVVGTANIHDTTLFIVLLYKRSGGRDNWSAIATCVRAMVRLCASIPIKTVRSI